MRKTGWLSCKTFCRVWQSLLCLFGAIAFASGSAGASSSDIATEEFSVETPDSVTLYVTWMSDRVEDTMPVPVVVLLPMMGNDRSSWHGFDSLLVARGLKVVSVDQRGHGASTTRAGQPYHWRDMDLDAFALMDDDVDAILRASHNRAADMSGTEVLDSILIGADFTKIAIVGASIGSSAALLYGADHPEVAALVLLSPGLHYRGLQTAVAMARYRGRPIYLTAAMDDDPSEEAVDSLYQMAGDGSDAARARTMHSGRAHGTDLFTIDRRYGAEVVDWLVAALGLTP